jgi:hypothetical protein
MNMDAAYDFFDPSRLAGGGSRMTTFPGRHSRAAQPAGIGPALPVARSPLTARGPATAALCNSGPFSRKVTPVVTLYRFVYASNLHFRR